MSKSQAVAYIVQTASFLPNEPVFNDEIETVLGMAGGKPSRARAVVLRSNGIRRRFYALDKHTGQPTHSNAQLTAAVVRGLVSADADTVCRTANAAHAVDAFTLNELACLATGTSTPDQLVPNHGVMVHGELGSPACEVVSLAGICLSGLAALKYAWMSVLQGMPNAVATGSDAPGAMLHARYFEGEVAEQVDALNTQPQLAFDRDFLRWMLSDGAGAVLLRPQPRQQGLSLRVDWLELCSYAHLLPTCMYQGASKRADGSLRGWREHSQHDWLAQSIFAVKQDVRLLNDNIVEHTLLSPLSAIMRKRGLRAEQIDWFLTHMSSMYFQPLLADALQRVGLPLAAEKWFTNLTSTGNTGAAAFYIMLDELMRSGRLQAGQTLLCFVPESGRFSSGFLHLTVVGHAGA